MGQNRNWSNKDYKYLKDNWGIISIPALAKKLNRSISAINIKAQRLDLGRFLDNGDYVTWNQLLITLGISGGSGYKSISWIKNRNFPIKYKRINQCKYKIVYINEFWKWAENNKIFLDFSGFEENTLGAEPDWVKCKRKFDCEKKFKYKVTPWTKTEDQKLHKLLNDFKYTYDDLSKILMRTNGAIQHRICDLKLKERPLKADNHTKWTVEELNNLCEMIKSGMNYELISEKLGKSSKAIRGKVYVMYLTENLDKVIEFIGNGSWGDGRPERKIGQWNCLSIEEKSMVKESLTKLAAIFRFEVKKHFEDCDYWQKDMCQLWDEFCTANETDCDSCTSYKRIQPQYCKRCGGTFYERNEEIYCERCRKQKVSQYLRKSMYLNRKEMKFSEKSDN